MSELSPNRRTVVRTAAWAVPAISVVAAAPSLAASPVGEPNLSTSLSVPPTRGPDPHAPGLPYNPVVTIPASTFNNTGDVAAEGLRYVFNSTAYIRYIDFILFGSVANPTNFGVVMESIGGSPFHMSMTIPANISTTQPGGSDLSPVSQRIVFEDGNPVTLNITVTAINGGVPFLPADVTI